MKSQTLSLKRIDDLFNIKQTLINNENLTSQEKETLVNLISQFKHTQMGFEDIPSSENMEVNLIETIELDIYFQNWIKAFTVLPSVISARLVDENDYEMFCRGTVILVQFSPSLAYFRQGITFELYLKGDEKSEFNLHLSILDMLRFPEFQSFSGTWKEAYSLMLEVLSKGWPQKDNP